MGPRTFIDAVTCTQKRVGDMSVGVDKRKTLLTAKMSGPVNMYLEYARLGCYR